MRKAHFVFAPPEIMRISPGFTLKAEKERMALQDQALEERYLNDLRKAGLSEELAIRRGEYWNVSSPPYSAPTSSAIAASWETTLRTLSSYRKFLDSLIEQHHGRFVNSAGHSVLRRVRQRREFG